MTWDDVPRLERREAPRFPVRLAVRFDGGEGWTRDVSASGMLFTTASAFSEGTTFPFTLVLEHTESGGRQEIPCEGVVVRIERGVPEHRVAVSISSYDMGRLEGQSSSTVDGPGRE